MVGWALREAGSTEKGRLVLDMLSTQQKAQQHY